MLPLCGYEIPEAPILHEPMSVCGRLAAFRVHGNGEVCDSCPDHLEDVAEDLGVGHEAVEEIA
jgi:hypothetical protein